MNKGALKSLKKKREAPLEVPRMARFKLKTFTSEDVYKFYFAPSQPNLRTTSCPPAILDEKIGMYLFLSQKFELINEVGCICANLSKLKMFMN